MPEPGEVEIFYADPVDENGKKLATVKFTLTGMSGFDKATVTKIPHDELVLEPDRTIHVRGEDFPGSGPSAGKRP